MRDIDLVPRAYRDAARVRGWLLRASLGYLVLGALFAAALAYASNAVDAEALAIEQLRLDQNELLRHRSAHEQLTNTRDRLAHQVGVLRTLRTGPRVATVFETMDRALDDNVWFTEWRYSQAPRLVSPSAPGLPAANEFARAWRGDTHMEIKGDAANHSVLADFVRRLSKQPAVRDVKLIRTRAVNRGALPAVGFELAVVIEAGEV